MLIAAAGAAVSSALNPSKIGDAVAGILGDTATDKRRKQHADDLLRQALDGNDAAVLQLCYEAFTRRTGLPGDARTPVDNKESPEAVQKLAVARLKQYVSVRGGLPPACEGFAAKLNTVVIPEDPIGPIDAALNAVREGVRQGVAQGSQQAASATIQETAAKYAPLLWLGALGVGAAVLFRYASRAK